MSVVDQVDLFIDGRWTPSHSAATASVVNPADELEVARVALADQHDLERAVDAASAAFEKWRKVPTLARSSHLRQAASLMRERSRNIGLLLTREQGKPLSESIAEAAAAAEIVDWFAEESRRAYGRVIPARSNTIRQLVLKLPVGPVAAFVPWNTPLTQLARKLSISLAAGCTVIVKGPEEAASAAAALVRCFADAGIPAGAVNLVFGVPADVSGFLIAHPVIRKISFTGSVGVGKQLAALAGQHMKRVTMELGGHAPAIVCADANPEDAARWLCAAKFRNAGQLCIAPTRFLVHDSVFEQFKDSFLQVTRSIRLGSGLESGVDMGPLIHRRRLDAVTALVDDARDQGARILIGGERVGNAGYFYAPTVIDGVSTSMRAMNEEPFGPIALLIPFRSLDDAIAEANRLPFGLAAYAHTDSSAVTERLSGEVQTGMLSINHAGLAMAETPFGGVKDSGYGSDGGSEALDAYLQPTFVTTASAMVRA